MNDNKLMLIHELLENIINLKENETPQQFLNEYHALLDADNDEYAQKILHDISVILELKSSDGKFSLNSDQERRELEEALKIINENLFTYHFQPIVSAADGEIFSYEALMRPKSTLCPSPYHILKYGDMTGNLHKIERSTFMNILGIIDKNKSLFRNKKVFINSIPTAKLPEKDLDEVKALLSRHSDCAVIEITEQSEMDENELNALKEMYRSINIQVAVDDYGTGYSNVHNLLRYTPDYVKIDRSLLSDIQNSSQKRYFVREIIDFCHTNNILALAEGVENSDELRTVIHLGVDLIQGYYTARPSADIIEAVPNEIRREIKQYRHEREDGKKHKIYTASQNEKIFLDRLVKEEMSCIVIGKNGSGDITLAGTPGMDTKIHVKIADDFKGCVILENAVLSNVKARPCIDIGENCEVRLILSGVNALKKSGIRVPESSRFICSGDGQLNISIDGSVSYAIGHDLNSKHGELIFEQGISVDSNSAESVCIGSGLGGKISILRGQFTLNMTGYNGVGIGSFNADTDLDLFACDITADITMQQGLAIGSFNRNCRAYIHNAAIKLYLSGHYLTGIGTFGGESCEVMIYEASSMFNISADYCSSVAAMKGSTRFSINKASMHTVVKGDHALGIGGFTPDTIISLVNSNSSVELVTKLNYKEYFKDENIEIAGGRTKININESETIIS